QERLDRAMHRLDVQVEREVPVLLSAFEDAAVMHIAGNINENVDLADLLCERIDGTRREDVQLRFLCPCQAVELRAVDVCGVDRCAFPDQGFGDCPPDSLSR